jgi:hypothetical protein
MWNINASLDHLQTFAQPASTGMCASYVRQAIEAGGMTLDRHISAKDYGASLLAAGFVPVHLALMLKSPAFLDFSLSADTPFKSGDIAVFEGTSLIPGGDNGHMQMFDGTHWISDFVQPHFSPGSAFDGVNVKVYRFRDFV